MHPSKLSHMAFLFATKLARQQMHLSHKIRANFFRVHGQIKMVTKIVTKFARVDATKGLPLAD